MFICPVIVSIVWFLKMYPKYLQKRFIKLTNVQLPCFVVKVFLMGKIVFWPPNARGALPERDCVICVAAFWRILRQVQNALHSLHALKIYFIIWFLQTVFVGIQNGTRVKVSETSIWYFFCLFYCLTFSFPCNVLNSISMLALVPVYVPVFVQLFT